jgi:phenylpropionate dioxygenase-like ring-hydroxylating dioxygenase large terminal subunit
MAPDPRLVDEDGYLASFVTDDVLAGFDASTVDVSEARYLPPWTYTSDDWFRFEQRAIFDRSWLCLGRSALAANPGDFFTVTVNDDPMVVIRGSDGALRVMSSVCQHRGSLLVEGAGAIERGLFRCPLHSWSYDINDGRLQHAPEMQQTNFDRDSICLPQLKVEEWMGFVFATFDPSAEPLAPTLGKLEAEMANYDVANMVSLPTIDIPGYPWNWRLMLENFMEPYHNAYLHKGIHDFALRHGFVDHDATENVIMHPTGFDEPGQAFNPTHRALLPLIPTLTDEQRQRVMFAMVPPMLLLGLVPDHMFWFIVLPNGPNEISLRIGLCVPPESMQVRNFGKLMDWIVDGIMMYNDQDVVADTRVQLGNKSRFANRGPMSWKETTVLQLNRWLVRRYRQHAIDRGFVKG